ncbi:uncharacterized protein [Epargyreus clarus]|uniref:uncharacterized protein n=1 Tax=Epargyreus clarus TaxID=520877 RepID=UPI003C2F7F18
MVSSCPAAKEQNPRVSSAINIYTDGSKHEDGSVGAAFVCYDTLGSQIAVKKHKLHNCCTVFQAELYAISRACQWAVGHDGGTSLHNTHSHVHIHTDSLAALNAIQNRSNTHPLVTQIHQHIHTHRNTHTIEIEWVKAHVGIAGNEAADAAAKSAAASHRAPDYTRIPMSYVKQNAKANTLATWQAQYDSSPQGQHTRRLLPSLKDIKELNKHVETSFQLTQILTGHGFHKAYLHRFGILSEDLCPCDGTSSQTTEHLLTTCAAFAAQRQQHEALCELQGVAPYEITKLMQKESSINSFQKLCKHIVNNLKQINNKN